MYFLENKTDDCLIESIFSRNDQQKVCEVSYEAELTREKNGYLLLNKPGDQSFFFLNNFDPPLILLFVLFEN